MTTVLHILNGDSTLWAMESIEMPGDKLVWRDVLSEGPVIADFASPKFWELRTAFMVQNYGADPADFRSKCIDEFERLKSLDHINELVLWFEYDLFCQINMLAVLHYLNQASISLPISLICVGEEPGFEGLIALGEISPKEYPRLFEERKQLSQDDLDYASSVFVAYCDEDPRNIGLALRENSIFPYLKGALEAHAKRFPFKSTHLSEIEMALIDIIEKGAKDPRETVGQALQWQKGTYYGFGDHQYFNYLKRLEPFLDEGFSLKPNAMSDNINRNYVLGGAKVSTWLWDDDIGAVIPS